MSARPRARLLDWRPRSQNTLRGFAKVQFVSDLIIAEIAVHVAGGRAWAAPPSRPWLNDNAVVIDETAGKLKWQPLLDFSTHGVRSSWSRQVLATLREAHPEVFTDVTEDAEP